MSRLRAQAAITQDVKIAAVIFQGSKRELVLNTEQANGLQAAIRAVKKISQQAL